MPKALFTHLIRCNSILNNTPVRASQRPPLEGRRKDFKRDCHILLQPSYRKKILTPQFSFSVHTNWKIFVFMQQTGGREGGREESNSFLTSWEDPIQEENLCSWMLILLEMHRNHCPTHTMTECLQLWKTSPPYFLKIHWLKSLEVWQLIYWYLLSVCKNYLWFST